VAFDRELLRRFYLSQGYADFRVVSSVAELSPDREGFFITFTLDEGERYRFGRIEVNSQLRNLNLDDVRGRIQVRDGDWYNANRIEASINAITEALGDLGYAFVEVRPRVERDRDNKTIAITFEIQEGPRVFVDRINVIGNVRTIDRVIRREMRLSEGDAFNATKLRRSRERIRALGFFERVEVTNVPSDAPDRTSINVEVAERSTGELSFGVGFSTSEGPLGDISIRERNLLGRGQDLRLGFSLSARRQQADLSFTEPYFLDRNIAAGFDAFRIERDFTRESDFRQRRTGGALRFGYRITEQLSNSWRYTVRQDEIFDVGAFASPLIRQEQGTFLTSAVGTTLLYDRRDDPNDPTDGWFVAAEVDVAGLGGDTRYVRGRLRGGVFYPVVDDWIASFLVEAGVIRAFGGRSVRLFDRWFVGGDNLRGFRQSGIGPRALSGEALGGNKYATAQLELSFPTPVPPEFGLRGFVFVDSGILWDVDQGANAIPFRDVRTVRVAAGVGVNWRSPFGPIRVSVGRAILKEDFDRTEIVRFGFGTRF
jgi:outer membrane protein insertion porin family